MMHEERARGCRFVFAFRWRMWNIAPPLARAIIAIMLQVPLMPRELHMSQQSPHVEGPEPSFFDFRPPGFSSGLMRKITRSNGD